MPLFRMSIRLKKRVNLTKPHAANKEGGDVRLCQVETFFISSRQLQRMILLLLLLLLLLLMLWTQEKTARFGIKVSKPCALSSNVITERRNRGVLMDGGVGEDFHSDFHSNFTQTFVSNRSATITLLFVENEANQAKDAILAL